MVSFAQAPGNTFQMVQNKFILCELACGEMVFGCFNKKKKQRKEKREARSESITCDRAHVMPASVALTIQQAAVFLGTIMHPEDFKRRNPGGF